MKPVGKARNKAAKVAVAQGCIYCLTNLVNGKRYVGKDKTGSPESHRWKDHIRNALNGKSKYPLHCAMRKAHKRDRCWKNFAFEIIWRGPTSSLNEKEIYYIKKLHTFIDDPLGNRSYNLTKGGDGLRAGHKLSKKTKEKMRATALLRCSDPVELEKMRAVQYRRYEDATEREKTGAAAALAWARPSTRKKQSASQLRRYEDITEREKSKAAGTLYWSGQEAREKQSAAQLRRYEAKSEHKKQSINAKQVWKTMTPEKRKAHSDAIKLGWAKRKAGLANKV